MSSFKDFCKKRQAKKLGLDAPTPTRTAPPPPARKPAPLTRKSPEEWTWAFVADRCGESGDGRVWRAARTHAASLACGVWAVPEASRPRSGGCWWVVGARAYVEVRRDVAAIDTRLGQRRGRGEDACVHGRRGRGGRRRRGADPGLDPGRRRGSLVGEDAAVVDDEAQTKGWILGALAVRRVAVLF